MLLLFACLKFLSYAHSVMQTLNKFSMYLMNNDADYMLQTYTVPCVIHHNHYLPSPPKGGWHLLIMLLIIRMKQTAMSEGSPYGYLEHLSSIQIECAAHSISVRYNMDFVLCNCPLCKVVVKRFGEVTLKS